MAAEKCSAWELKLKQEQRVIMEREAELSLRTKENKSKFDQKELERLIDRHHASIEAFNMKLDDFKKKCAKRSTTKKSTKSAHKQIKSTTQPVTTHKPDTTQQQSASNKSRVTTPEAEVAASDELIKTLKGRYIQVGAFKRRVLADRTQQRLEKMGFESIIITRPYVYALWVGPYESYKAAKVAKETLLNDYKMDGYLIRFK